MALLTSKHHTHLEKVRHHARKARKKLAERFPAAHQKLNALGFDLRDVRKHSAKIASGMAIAGGLLLASPALLQQTHSLPTQVLSNSDRLASLLHDRLQLIFGKKLSGSSKKQEDDVSQAVQEVLGIRATAELDGHRLNTSIGRIGGEQHLPRFPGDSIGQHDALQQKGITAGRGAFGYFAQSKGSMSTEDEQKEKYYVAVQTLYLPDWNQNYAKLKEWYKFRKVLVINPSNGKSVVAVIGDAGPAAWTGKQFGGSPEIMEYLQPYANKNNGMVLLYFIDDHDQAVALGPVQSQTQFIASR